MTYIDIETAEWAANLLGYRPSPQPYTEPPMATFNRPAWHAQAACRGMGVEQWFPSRGESAKDARAVCRTCPVRAECLAAGLEQGTRVFGIWGGLTGRELEAYRRRRLPKRAA